MKHFLSELKTNQEGSGLILALMTLMVLAVLGASLGAITIGSHRLSAVNRDDSSAYYIAEAGANQAYEEIERLVLAAYEESNDSEKVFYEKLENQLNTIQNAVVLDQADLKGANSKATVQISELHKEDRTQSYRIRSEGFVSGRSRVVEKEFDVTYVKEVVQKEVPKIESDVVIANKIKYNANSHIISYRKFESEDEFEFYKNLVDDFPPENQFTDSAELLNNKITTTPEHPINIKTSNLNLNKLTVTGDGVVNIYVKNQLDFGHMFKGIHDAKNVRIFYAGNQNLTVPRNYIFNGSMHIKRANITFNTGAKFYGPVLLGSRYKNSVKFNGQGQGANQGVFDLYLMAPHTSVKSVAHAEINGVIIADEVEALAGTKIYNNNFFYQDQFAFNLSAERGNTDLISSRPIVEPK